MLDFSIDFSTKSCNHHAPLGQSACSMIIDYYLDNDTFLGVITLIRSLELRVLIPTISKRIETRNFYDNAKQLLRNADLICGLCCLNSA